jgi:Tetracyclin repressor-like, C-terminal domain
VKAAASPAGRLGELDHRVRAESGQHVEHLLVAPGRDDPAGAEVPRGLHRELAGDAGGAEDQHGLAWLQRAPPAERQPGRHPGIPRRGCYRIVQAAGDGERHLRSGRRVLRHGAAPGAEQDPLPAGQPARADHPRHGGQAVATAPLDTAAKLDLLATIDDYVFGHVIRAGEQQARAASTDPAHTAAITGYIQGQISSGQFPHLSKLARDPAAQALADLGQLDQRFERGLQTLLDGAAAD